MGILLVPVALVYGWIIYHVTLFVSKYTQKFPGGKDRKIIQGFLNALGSLFTLNIIGAILPFIIGYAAEWYADKR